MAPTTIFFLGATGYLGGAVLVDLLSSIPQLSVTALVRNEKDVAPIENLGVQVIRGGLSDLDIIRRSASQADVVINIVNPDDIPLAEALIDALKERGGRPIFLQTSGGQAVMSDEGGRWVEGISRAYDDGKESDIASIPSTNDHVAVDQLVLNATAQGLIQGYVMCPPMLYGRSRAPVRQTNYYFAPVLVREAIRRDKVVHAGDGSNVFSLVHVLDVARLYSAVLRRALTGEDADRPLLKRVIFSRTGPNYRMSELLGGLAKVMHKKSLIKTTELTSVPPEDIQPESGATPFYFWYAENTVVEPTLATSDFGWSAQEQPILDVFEKEVEDALELIARERENL